MKAEQHEIKKGSIKHYQLLHKEVAESSERQRAKIADLEAELADQRGKVGELIVANTALIQRVNDRIHEDENERQDYEKQVVVIARLEGRVRAQEDHIDALLRVLVASK